MRTIFYDEEISTLNLIFAEYPQGGLSVLCPVCKAEMIVVLDVAAVEKRRRGRGIYCKDNHVLSLFNFRGS